MWNQTKHLAASIWYQPCWAKTIQLYQLYRRKSCWYILIWTSYIYVCVYVCMYVSIYLSIDLIIYLFSFLSFFLSIYIYIYIYTCRVSSDKSSNCSHLRLTIREAYPIPMPLLWLKTNKYSTIICTVKWLLKCHKCHQKIQDAQYIGSLGCISTIPAQKAWTKPPKPRVTHVPQIAPPSGK